MASPNAAYGTKPSALPKSASADSDAELLAALEALPAPKAGGQTRDPNADDAELIAALNAQGQAAAPVGNAASQAFAASGANPGATVLEGVARAADYPGGLIRTGAASLAGVANAEDWKNAAVGKAPNSEEYLKRGGVSEGWEMNVPALGKITGRNVEGFLLDIGTDPLSAISKLVKSSPYLKKALASKGFAAADPTTAAGRFATLVGDAIHDSAYSKVDAKLMEQGKGKLSTLMRAEGSAVTPGQAASQVEKIESTMGAVRQTLYDRATELGVSVDMGHPLKRAEAVIKGISGTHNEGTRTALLDFLDEFKRNGPTSIDKVSEWKTELYHSLPKNAYGANGKLTPVAQRFKKALAADLKEAIEGAGNKAERGLGTEIANVNEKWGTLLEAQKMKRLGMDSVGMGKLGVVLDATLLGTGNLQALAAKKAAELVYSPGGRMVVGRALSRAGRDGAVDAVTRRALIDSQRQTPTDPAAQDILAETLRQLEEEGE